jgi:hypothetical protein
VIGKASGERKRDEVHWHSSEEFVTNTYKNILDRMPIPSVIRPSHYNFKVLVYVDQALDTRRDVAVGGFTIRICEFFF